MTNKEVILKSIRFIESNLKNDINVFEVSREVCYSLYHFIRLFQSITGFSPKNYIQQRRLSEAALELRNTNKKITDIGYDYQFGSPEAFSRAFRKQFKINPTEVRKGFSLTTLPLLKPISSDYIYQSDKLRNEPPELIENTEKLLVGTSFFIHNDNEINDLSKEWGLFMNEVHTIKNVIKPERYYQVQYWSDNQDIDGMYFFTGIEVSKFEDINPLFVLKTIPEGKYLRFIHNNSPLNYDINH
jgi:AraC family transcriptional regulator